MYKKRTMGGRRKRLAAGKGIFSKIWRGIKKAGSVINDGLKKTKIISTLAPIIGASRGQPGTGAAIGSVASSAGYGRVRRRRTRTRKVGGSLFSKLRTAMRAVKPYASRLNSHLKSSRWLSNELKSKNYPTAAKLVSALGYGKSRKRVGRRKKRVVRRGRGTGFSGSIGNAIKSNRSVVKF